MLSWTSISNRTEWKIGMQRWPNLELLRDFYNKCQDFHGDDDYILVVGIYRD